MNWARGLDKVVHHNLPSVSLAPACQILSPRQVHRFWGFSHLTYEHGLRRWGFVEMKISRKRIKDFLFA